MGFSTSFPTDREAFEPAEQGEGLLDDVAEFAEGFPREPPLPLGYEGAGRAEAPATV